MTGAAELDESEQRGTPGIVCSTAGFGVMLAAWRAAKTAKRDSAERAAIAKAFNDRYCYRVMYEPKAAHLSGTAVFGLMPRGGNRWMCPACNRIHAPTECSVWSGLQYPACCATCEGNRLSHGVGIS